MEKDDRLTLYSWWIEADIKKYHPDIDKFYKIIERDMSTVLPRILLQSEVDKLNSSVYYIQFTDEKSESIPLHEHLLTLRKIETWKRMID